jgi:DNA-binding ferritin-like protein
MFNDQTDKTTGANMNSYETPKSHKIAFGVLAGGLAVALGVNGYLISRSNDLTDEIARTRAGASTEISKLHEATDAAITQQQQRFDEVAQQVKGYNDNTSVALKRARAEAQKKDEELRRQLAEQREQQERVASEIGQFKDVTTSKFTEVAGNVDTVKANVEDVRANVASTRADFENTTAGIRADMKSMVGDMGVMSGLIATNQKELDALRALGDRNYYEFELAKNGGPKKVGDITLTLKKADLKRNRFTVDVFADDKHIEKKDKTVNEPVQMYVNGLRQPYEIVVNQVNKNKIVGYLATPKVKMARR